MSVLPVQVPTRDFMRSNSREPGFGVGGSPAFREREAARRNAAQGEKMLVFMLGGLWVSKSGRPFYHESGGSVQTGWHLSGSVRVTFCFQYPAACPSLRISEAPK